MYNRLIIIVLTFLSNSTFAGYDCGINEMSNSNLLIRNLIREKKIKLFEDDTKLRFRDFEAKSAVHFENNPRPYTPYFFIEAKYLGHSLSLNFKHQHIIGSTILDKRIIESKHLYPGAILKYTLDKFPDTKSIYYYLQDYDIEELNKIISDPDYQSLSKKEQLTHLRVAIKSTWLAHKLLYRKFKNLEIEDIKIKNNKIKYALVNFFK